KIFLRPFCFLCVIVYIRCANFKKGVEMKKIYPILIFLLAVSYSYSQFSADAYKEYLKSHENMTYEQLLDEFPAGRFLDGYPTDISNIQYLDSIRVKYGLTGDEMSLLQKNGFVVSGRKEFSGFINGFYDTYLNDLPLYISSDAILHAVHYSFGKMLENVEENTFYERIKSIINHNNGWPFYQMIKDTTKYINNDNYPIFIKAVKDYDLYISIADYLIDGKIYTNFSDNRKLFDEIINDINSYKPADVLLFAETPRMIDFSQFIPRGHYTKSIELTNYFKCMTWLSQAVMFIKAPQRVDPKYRMTENDIKRQLMLIGILGLTDNDTSKYNESLITEYNELNTWLNLIAGKSDNLDLIDAGNALKKAGITSLFELLDTNKLNIFRDELIAAIPEGEMYSSKIIESDINNPEPAAPDSYFALFGQKATLDGFITANLVFDRIIYENNKILRMMPKTLDILFSLGNDAAIQLLEYDINKYKYSRNLAALRYCVNSLDSSYWTSSIYGSWLYAITRLNPPKERKNLPGFMQTAAWWQKSMNTQLASWSELRHDFILYAKQGGRNYMCSHPYCYLEPVPEFYKAIRNCFYKFLEIEFSESDYVKFPIIQQINNLIIISEKELKHERLTNDEIKFLREVFSTGTGCSVGYFFGWYLSLYYPFGTIYSSDFDNFNNYIVADVHTAPTDGYGNWVGWVLHAGTGKPKLAVVIAPDSSGKLMAFAGPVYNYKELVTNNFLRLTDNEWLNAGGIAPQWTKLYSSDENGALYQNPVSLLTYNVGIEDKNNNSQKSGLELSCSPNPASGRALVRFDLPQNLTGSVVNLEIYNIEGKLIRTLLSESLPSNNYGMMWDCCDAAGRKAPSGAYLVKIEARGEVKTIVITVQW
ncbi:MAG: hypothetical protein QG635_1619, partial [Bacteroidota bacterium]|nr:hypothetical protein [Bacteroidota bacterium]